MGKATQNCTTVGVMKPIIIFYFTFSIAAALIYMATIIIIVRTRAYRQFHHRLSLYLSVGGCLRILALWISAVPVDYQTPDDSPISVREGWNGLCAFGGFVNQYTGFLQTFTVVWISVYIFFAVVFLKQLTQRKYEMTGLAIVALTPFLLTLVPFISKDSYGLSQSICWIAEPSCEGQGVTFIYSLAIATVPQIVLTQFGLLLMSIAIISLLRRIYLKIFEHHYWIVVKEILPVMLFPLLYSLVFFGRMIGLIIVGKNNPGLVGTVTIALILTACSVSLPISLLLRPNVRKALSLFCDSRVDEEETEMISGGYSKLQ